jgi:hypothetical protein
MRQLLTRGDLHFENKELMELKNFIQGRDNNYRRDLQAKIIEYKSKEEILAFDQILI